MELWQRVNGINKAYLEFLLKYKWEWFCSLNLQQGFDYDLPPKHVPHVKLGFSQF